MNKREEKIGLEYWMNSVLEQCEQVRLNLAAEPVHDLRVALRRCRSMADELRTIDPNAAWKPMKKSARKLFRALGALRDAQVLTEWVEKLSSPDDPVGKALAAYAAEREQQLKQDAVQLLDTFDDKRWRAWSRTLPRRAVRVKPGSIVFKHMALERWNEAHELHRQALRNRTRVAFHQLRIGLKRLRYTVENFLPQLHHAWIEDLKELQDLLGEIHDLDVLWQIALQNHMFPDRVSRQRWRERVEKERMSRLRRYREKMLGRHSLWHLWRKELPPPAQLKTAAGERLKLWASSLDPDFRHSARVARLAVQLYDALSVHRLIAAHRDLRSILQAAALLHDVGRSQGARKHHKATLRMVWRLDAPLGWTIQDLRMAAVVARYHRGALPQPHHKAFAGLRKGQKKQVVLLAGILRLADALDARHEGLVKRLKVDSLGSPIIILAEGYSPTGPLGERVPAARHLLECFCEKPVLVRPWTSPRARRVRTQIPRLGHAG